jgi:hypothetical protein
MMTQLIDTDIGTIASDWKVLTLKEMCEHPQYGYTASAEDTGNARFLRITDITDSGVKWETVPFCECPEDSIERYLLKSGDIVFARIGATTGKSYLITDPPRSVFASYLIRVRCKEGIDPDFLSNLSLRRLLASGGRAEGHELEEGGQRLGIEDAANSRAAPSRAKKDRGGVGGGATRDGASGTVAGADG